MKRIIVIGSSGHARVLVDIARQQGMYEVIGLLDPFRDRGDIAFGQEILGGEKDLPGLVREYELDAVAVAIGDNFDRATVAARVRALCPELPFATLVHPNATVAGDVILGEGTVVMAGAVINPGVRVGRLCILNTRCSLDHDSQMGHHASLAPGVTTGGNCRIGDWAAIGIGATLVHGVAIGEHTVIGAASLVLRDVESYVVVHGSPARVVRPRKQGDRYLMRPADRQRP